MDSGQDDGKPTADDPISLEASNVDGVNTSPEQLQQHDDAKESEEKKEEIKDGGAEEVVGGEALPRPPLDVEKISQELDGYIAALGNLKGEESGLPDVPIYVEQYTVLIEAKIGEYDSGEKHVNWISLTAEDSSSFMQAITRLSSLSNLLSKFSSEFKFAYTLNRIGAVIERAMSYMEEEFRILCEDFKICDSDSANEAKSKQQLPESEQNPPAAESEESGQEVSAFPGYSDEILSELVRLSTAMITAGYEIECTQAYFFARRSALEESLKKIEFRKCSIDDVQKMQWDSLEREIVTWIRTFKAFAAVHFPVEKKVAGNVFPGHPTTAETLFYSLSSDIMIQLLNFAEAVAMTKRAAEKLFKFLDIYETLRDVLPMTESLFPEEWGNEVKTEASVIKNRLGEAMILIFLELENSIKADSGKTPVPGGAIHPLTRYTMNYLKYTCEYTATLDQVFKEHQKIEMSESSSGSEGNPSAESPFRDQMVNAMDLLDANLEAKSKLYKDPALSSIFMMNNGRYILQKARGSSDINSLMGDSWIRKRSSDLRQYHKGYQRETWGKLLNCLNPEGLTSHGKVLKPVLKERFKSFNTMFDEIHKAQSSWVVSDEQLQSELRVSISNMVIPAYRSFLGRYSQTFTPGRQSEKYVKYQPEDIETCIDELFDGSAAAQGKKKP